MTGQTSQHPAEIVAKTRHPKRLPANTNRPGLGEVNVLLLGLGPRDMAALTPLVPRDGGLLSLSDLDELLRGAGKLAQVDRVILPLTTPSFDALEAAVVLAENGFRGRLQVLSPDLPRPDLVKREIAAVARGVQVELVMPRAAWRTLA